MTEEDVQTTVEGMMKAIWQETLGVNLEAPFKRIPYAEAMDLYGSDKPDLRFGLPLTDVTAQVREHDGGGIGMFKSALEDDTDLMDPKVVKAWRLPAAQAKQITRANIDKLEAFAKGMGAGGLARARVAADGAWAQTPLKSMTEGLRQAINTAVGLEEGDLVFFQFGSAKLCNTVLGALRLHLAKQHDLIPKDRWEFCWVTDFPLFERAEDGALAAAHHPFTMPKPEDLPNLESNPGSVRARAYDLVLNGNEIAGGSIRIHQADVQARIFRAMGLSDEDAQTKFGFLLEAFKYGPPPHGGIAAGLDRLTMLICGADSLRDVIAFPKTQKGTDMCTGAPSPVAEKQLAELHIGLRNL